MGVLIMLRENTFGSTLAISAPIKNNLGYAWVILMTSFYDHEKDGSKSKPLYKVMNFINFLCSSSLIDIEAKGCKYTWSNNNREMGHQMLRRNWIGLLANYDSMSGCDYSLMLDVKHFQLLGLIIVQLF